MCMTLSWTFRMGQGQMQVYQLKARVDIPLNDNINFYYVCHLLWDNNSVMLSIRIFDLQMEGQYRRGQRCRLRHCMTNCTILLKNGDSTLNVWALFTSKSYTQTLYFCSPNLSIGNFHLTLKISIKNVNLKCQNKKIKRWSPDWKK